MKSLLAPVSTNAYISSSTPDCGFFTRAATKGLRILSSEEKERVYTAASHVEFIFLFPDGGSPVALLVEAPLFPLAPDALLLLPLLLPLVRRLLP